MRAMRNFPHTRPTLKGICTKYAASAQSGGWNADVFNENKLQQLDLSFKDRVFTQPYKQKKAAAIFRHEFAKNMRKALNRKATPPGEIPAELWRIALNPKWLQPNYRYPWALKTVDEQPQQWQADRDIVFVGSEATSPPPYPYTVDR